LGNQEARRASAKAAIGPDAAAEILGHLRSSKRNWTTLPVVGSRGDAATVIGDALSGRRSSKKANGSEVVEKLVQAAEDASNAGLVVIIDEMGKFLEHAAIDRAIAECDEIFRRRHRLPCGAERVFHGAGQRAGDEQDARLGRR